MLVDGIRNGIRLGHTDLDALVDLHGEGLLHLDGVWLLDRVWHWLLDDLGHHLVHGHLNGMLDIDVDGVGLRDGNFHVVGHSHRDGMRDWHSDLLVNGNWIVLDVLRVRGVHFLLLVVVVASLLLLVTFLVMGRIARGDCEDEAKGDKGLRGKGNINIKVLGIVGNLNSLPYLHVDVFDWSLCV